MKRLLIIIFASFSTLSFGQQTLQQLLKTYNDGTVPYISVQELAMPKTNAIILDSRELAEYNVSHIKNAAFVGYDNFKIETIKDIIPDKNQMVVVYCSLGIRSEQVAKKLKKDGYTNVLNLYGGIFEWKNNNFPVVDSTEKTTENVHVFSLEWEAWLKKGNKIF